MSLNKRIEVRQTSSQVSLRIVNIKICWCSSEKGISSENSQDSLDLKMTAGRYLGSAGGGNLNCGVDFYLINLLIE